MRTSTAGLAFRSGGPGGDDETFAKTAPATPESALSLRREQMVQCLVSLLNPGQAYASNRFVTVPFGAEDRAVSFVQRSVYGNFQVPQGNVGNQEGVCAFLPFDGCSHFVRLSPIFAGQFIPAQSDPTTSDFPSGLYQLDIVAATKFFVPVSQQNNIQLQPPLIENAVYGRSVAFAIRVYSDATSTTSAAMSGTFSASSVQDFRALISFEPAVLQQAALNKKDGQVAVPVQTGVVLVQGPDIPNRIGVVDTAAVVNSGDSGIALNVLNGQLLSGNYITLAQPYSAGRTSGSGSCWLSTTTKTIAQPGINAPTQVTIPNLGLDNLSLRVTCNVTVDAAVTNAVYPPAGTKLISSITAVTFYAQVDTNVIMPTGNFKINLTCHMQTEIIEDIVQPQFWAGPITVTNSAPPGLVENASATGLSLTNGTTPITQGYYQNNRTVMITPIMPDQWYSFIGTFLTTAHSQWGGGYYENGGGSTYPQVPGGTPNPAPVTGQPYAPVNSNFGQVSYISAAPGTSAGYQTNYVCVPCVSNITNVDVIANDLYGRGLQGPARIVQWTNVAPGQNIVIRGEQIVQVVASNRIVPFYQQGIVSECPSMNFYPMMTHAFNSTSQVFKRVYLGTEYAELVNKILPTLVASEVLQGDTKMAKMIEELAPVTNALTYFADGTAAHSDSVQSKLEEVTSAYEGDIAELKSWIAQLARQIDGMKYNRPAIAPPPVGPLAVDHRSIMEKEQDLHPLAEHSLKLTAHAAGSFASPLGVGCDYGTGDDDCGGQVYGAGSNMYGGQVYGAGSDVYGGQVYGAGSNVYGGMEEDECGGQVYGAGEQAEAAAAIVRPIGMPGKTIDLVSHGSLSGIGVFGTKWSDPSNTFFVGAPPKTVHGYDFSPFNFTHTNVRDAKKIQRTFTFAIPNALLWSVDKFVRAIPALTKEERAQHKANAPGDILTIKLHEYAKSFEASRHSFSVERRTGKVDDNRIRAFAASLMDLLRACNNAADADRGSTFYDRFCFIPLMTETYAEVPGQPYNLSGVNMRILVVPRKDKKTEYRVGRETLRSVIKKNPKIELSPAIMHRVSWLVQRKITDDRVSRATLAFVAAIDTKTESNVVPALFAYWEVMYAHNAEIITELRKRINPVMSRQGIVPVHAPTKGPRKTIPHLAGTKRPEREEVPLPPLPPDEDEDIESY